MTVPRMTIRRPGKIVIISSPSGAGKSSICRKLLERNRAWRFSISYTTRRPRQNEKNGREYFFVEESSFERMRDQGKFAESCRVHHYRYATPRGPLDAILKSGGVMLLDVDVKGAMKLRRLYPTAALIFILPPSRAELARRLRNRGTESKEQLRVRLANSEREMKSYKSFDNTVINDDLTDAVDTVEAIVRSLHTRRKNLDPKQIRRILG